MTHFFLQPFGAPSQHYDRYDTIVLIGGGIGVTPFASILKHLVTNDSQRKKKKQVYFYWIARNHIQFEWLDELLKDLLFKSEEHATLSLEINVCYTGIHNVTVQKKQILDLVTRDIHFDESSRRFIINGNYIIHYERPNFIQEIKRIMSNTDGIKCGVFTCGPDSMCSAVQKVTNNFADCHFYKEIF